MTVRRRPRRLTARSRLGGLLGALFCSLWVGQAPPVEASAAERPLFVVDDSGRFGVSLFALRYQKPPSVLFAEPRLARIELAYLDRHGYFPTFDTPVDTTQSASAEVAQTVRKPVRPLTQEEKRALDPPKPGVRVGIPSAAAATGTLLGGTILLMKVLSDLF